VIAKSNKTESAQRQRPPGEDSKQSARGLERREIPARKIYNYMEFMPVKLYDKGVTVTSRYISGLYFSDGGKTEQ
jgi:hypothetical protein